jgi:C1A family cysteine protease
VTPIIINKDLRAVFGEVREQGQRPTCLAFSTSDAHAFNRGSPFTALSVEYLFYYAVQQRDDRNPTKGISLEHARIALEKEGQPKEEFCPYQTVLPTDPMKWKPTVVSGVYRRKLTKLPSVEFDEVVRKLNTGSPVVIILTLSHSFYRPDSSGIVTSGNPGSNTGKHAVVAVGHGSLLQERAVLIRNSWGKYWGSGGYGWLTEGYLINRVLALATVNEL